MRLLLLLLAGCLPPAEHPTELLRLRNRNKPVSYSAPIDLAPYDLIFLGSPIWYWRPTAFIYAFVRDHDFSNKRVVLFYTNEGGLSKDAIPEWRTLVESRGGRVIDVIGVDRKKDKDVIAAIDRAVDAHHW